MFIWIFDFWIGIVLVMSNLLFCLSVGVVCWLRIFKFFLMWCIVRLCG